MAYAAVAGLAPVVGLYALLAPAVAYALLGSSRQVIVGPEGSLAALVAAAVLPMAASGSAHAGALAAALALLVGALFGLARLARIGWVADYFSRPVLVGYIHGVAVVLVIGQLGKLLGLSIAAQDPLPQLAEVLREAGGTSAATVAVAAAALAVLIPLRYVAPRLPAALIVVVTAIAATEAIGRAAHGVAVVGPVPSGLPRPGLPDVSGSDLARLVPAVIGLFMVSFADEILTARSFAGRADASIGVGQELVAMGAANALAGLTHGMPVGASGSRTAVNAAMGARSQLSGLLAAGVVALVLLVLTGPIADLPKAVLAAVIVAACVGLVDQAAWRDLARADRVELGIAALTAVGVVAVGVLQAIAVAVALSVLDVVRRSARPHDAVLGWVPSLGRWADVSLHRDARVTPGIVVYRLDDRLFFANAGYVKGRVREALRAAPSAPRALVLDAEGMSHVDAAGLRALVDLARRLRRDGVALHIARLKGPVRRRLDAAGVTAAIGPEHFHPTTRTAVEAAVTRAAAPGAVAR
jgi:high affinity sulfate transporter 1